MYPKIKGIVSTILVLKLNDFFFNKNVEISLNIVKYKLTFFKNSIVNAYGRCFELFSLINLRFEFLSGRQKHDC